MREENTSFLLLEQTSLQQYRQVTLQGRVGGWQVGSRKAIYLYIDVYWYAADDGYMVWRAGPEIISAFGRPPSAQPGKRSIMCPSSCLLLQSHISRKSLTLRGSGDNNDKAAPPPALICGIKAAQNSLCCGTLVSVCMHACLSTYIQLWVLHVFQCVHGCEWVCEQLSAEPHVQQQAGRQAAQREGPMG